MISPLMMLNGKKIMLTEQTPRTAKMCYDCFKDIAKNHCVIKKVSLRKTKVYLTYENKQDALKDYEIISRIMDGLDQVFG